MPVSQRITYRPDPFQFTHAKQVELLRVLAPRPAARRQAWVPGEIQNPSWDGMICLHAPTYSLHYEEELAFAVNGCRPELERRRVRLDCYTQKHQRMRLSERTYQACAGRKWIRGPFQLGRRWGGFAAEEVTDAIIEHVIKDEIGLDPASVLYILTMSVMEYGVEALQTMSIDCPGAEYDPEGEGKFSDCPRWNIATDRSDDDEAFFFLDWNGRASLQARAHSGPATMLLLP